MGNYEKILSLLQQNRSGIRIQKIAKMLRVDDSTVYRHLESLDRQHLAYYERGIAYYGSRGLVRRKRSISSSIRVLASWLHVAGSPVVFFLCLCVLGSMMVMGYVDPSLRWINQTYFAPVRPLWNVSPLLFLLPFGILAWYLLRHKTSIDRSQFTAIEKV